MRYPKHLILDLHTPTQVATLPNWKTNFISKTSIRLSSETLQHVTSVYSSDAKSHLYQLPRNTNTNFSSHTTTSFDINFLRKEKVYTKLKYSRCPQYDMVSGGFAALLAGFIGFLISEKFGIELVDSGDFYIAFMYVVFATFSLRPLIRIYSKDSSSYTPISIKYVINFSRDLLLLILAEVSFWVSRIRRS